MLTVAHLITTLERGGAEAMLTKLAKAHAGQGVRPLVISLTGPGIYGPELEAAGIPVWSLGLRRGVPEPGALLKLVGILRREKPDLLQSWLYHADLLALLAAPLAGVRRLAWNIRCSDMDMRRYSRLSRWLVALLARLSPLPDAVLVNSEAGRLLHHELGYRPKRWETIANGFDITRFRPDPEARRAVRAELGLPDDALAVGLIARFDPMKDHASFLAAAERVARRHPRARFVLAGLGIEPANPAFAAASSGALAGRASLLGPRADIPHLLAALDVGCLSSAFGEGFPNVIGEAMACGLPCVATDVGDSGRIIADTGRVVPPANPAALAEALDDLLDLPDDERRRLGAAARQRIEEHYALAIIAGRYLDLYRELTGVRD
ncbi:MAG: glycosyltransferase [Rhodospirillaceae bacterium]